jgi:hypothetical protein
MTDQKQADEMAAEEYANCTSARYMDGSPVPNSTAKIIDHDKKEAFLAGIHHERSRAEGLVEALKNIVRNSDDSAAAENAFDALATYRGKP